MLILIIIVIVIWSVAIWFAIGALTMRPKMHKIMRLPWNKELKCRWGLFELLFWPYILWRIRNIP